MSIFDRIIAICVWPGRLVGWLVLPLILFVCLAVMAAQLGMNSFADWEGDVPFLGSGITVNTLIDLQWHIFALIVLFGGALALCDDAHVSVDFMSANFGERTRIVVTILGDLLLLLPFCAIIVWYGMSFAIASFDSGEGSNYGGLTDRWFIKACVPIGFGLLGLVGLARVGRGVADLLRPRRGME